MSGPEMSGPKHPVLKCRNGNVMIRIVRDRNVPKGLDQKYPGLHCPGPNYPGAICPESNMSGFQTSRSEISGSECPCAKCLDPKRLGAKYQGPKCLHLK